MRLSTVAAAALIAAASLAASDARAQGVTLFQERSLRGPSQTFWDDVPDLKYTHFGNRRASSIAVSPGCTAIVYEYPHFSGRSTTFRDNDNNLGNTAVGENTASSMRVNCRGDYPHWRPQPQQPEYRPPHESGNWGGGYWDSGRRGAVLYRDREGRGPSAHFDRDVPDLDRTRFGSRMASSVDVSPGCILTLYEYPNFRGRSTEFRERDNNLRNTGVGEDTASSLRIRCR
jgi:hypothetical protein